MSVGTYVLMVLAADNSGRSVRGKSVFHSTNTGFVGSKPTRNVDISECIYSVRVLVLAGGGEPCDGADLLPTVYKT
jgi:hypothetical protein